MDRELAGGDGLLPDTPRYGMLAVGFAALEVEAIALAFDYHVGKGERSGLANEDGFLFFILPEGVPFSENLLRSFGDGDLSAGFVNGAGLGKRVHGL